jgi:hypothetical protein
MKKKKENVKINQVYVEGTHLNLDLIRSDYLHQSMPSIISIPMHSDFAAVALVFRFLYDCVC